LRIPVSTYTCYEDGKRGFHHHVHKLANKFKVPFSWLAGPITPTDDYADILAGLSPEELEAVQKYIEFLRFKQGK